MYENGGGKVCHEARNAFITSVFLVWSISKKSSWTFILDASKSTEG